MPDADHLGTPTEVARHLGVSVLTLKDWRYRRGGPAYLRVGRTVVRYRWEDVRAWEDTQRREHVPDDAA
jgi:hypothetical protein